MENKIEKGAHRTLIFTTTAFVICFAAWMLNGVLVTFLVDNKVFDWGPVEIGWLLGIPVLTGSIFRLPLGILTDKYGGRPVFTLLLLFSAIPMYLLSHSDSFWSYALCSFGFGLAGTGFAVGVAFTSSWYPKKHQGFALGVFGAGNAGAAITTVFAPSILNKLTLNGAEPDSWRMLPQIYAAGLVVMALIFFFSVKNRIPVLEKRSLADQLKPLSSRRVWRFGLYYVLVFGMFVAFSQWLIPYCVNVYYAPLVTAGILASIFSFPSGIIRALGGWMSDKWGARKVMYGVLGSSVLFSLLLSVPKMEVLTPGNGIMAGAAGEVSKVTDTEIVAGGRTYALNKRVPDNRDVNDISEVYAWPMKESWQEPVVKEGQQVKKKELLAKGHTQIKFQANIWIFTVMAMIIGIVWGIGKAAVYKHIPDYFPGQVGVVGGLVGMIGGLGGFIGPILFGYLLEYTGLWTSSWMLMLLLSIICLIWMHTAIQMMMRRKVPELMQHIEH